MTLRNTMPPDITLAFARLEACHFGVRLETTKVGNMILRVSEWPQVMDAMQEYQPPQAVPLDGSDLAIRAVRLLGENMTMKEVGAQLGASVATVHRCTAPLYRAFGTGSAPATARRLIEQGSIQTSELSYADLGKVPLSRGEKLLGYLISRGWSEHSLKKHFSSTVSRGSALFERVDVTNAAALTMSLFARGQLMPDPELHELWKRSGGYPDS